MPQIEVIPMKINPLTRLPSGSLQKRRVAAYARVSTGSDEQFTSYEAQIDYYINFIKSNPTWEFVGIYADEGISGTNTKHREEFNRMIADALDGKIDLIVTKSVSRFARNTVDSLVTIRKLKEHGCECFFQKENIYTFDSRGEVMLTIMSSFAQEESRSISENVTWGHRKRFADGKIMLSYKHFLGYEKDENGIPKIVESEAAIIRRIYKMFAEGKTAAYIAKVLTAEGIPTPGEKTQWRANTVISILTNEKYRGSALLQKSFTVDFLTKKKKINEGEVEQYYIRESHPPIIDPEEWDWVQIEMKRRNSLKNAYSCSSIFSSKIVCGDCGKFYGSKVWHSNSKYKRTIWRCNQKFNNEKTCSTPNLNEDEIKKRFIVAFNRLLGRKQTALATCMVLIETLTDTSEIDNKLTISQQELEVVKQLVENCISDNAQHAIDQDEYLRRYTTLSERFSKEEEKHNMLLAEKSRKLDQKKVITAYMKKLEEADTPLLEFDEKLWSYLVLYVKANRNGTLTFVFRDNSEITV